MKIGIMTFWWSNDNYGQILQCYALQKYLRDRGHDAFLIRYHRDTDIIASSLLEKFQKVFSPIQLLNFIRSVRRFNSAKKEEVQNTRLFEEFRNKYIVQSQIEYFHYSDLKENPPTADVYIVGSDQVWNTLHLPLRRCKNFLHAYFLDFGDNSIKRFAYAASRKVSLKLEKDYVAEVFPLLKKFTYVSVREKELIPFCSTCGYERAEYVCDPTLLLDVNDYRKIYRENNIRMQRNKFALVYMLGNSCKYDFKEIRKFFSKKNLDVVYVTGNAVANKFSKFFATIPEWLYLVDNAEYVITNSFHCGAFSILFHKQFGIVPLSGHDKGMNQRFENLFELFGIDSRYIYKSDFNILEKTYEERNIQVPQSFINVLEQNFTI